MIDGTFIKELKATILENQLIMQDGVPFSQGRFSPIRQVDRPKAVTVNTLEGFVNFVKENFKEFPSFEKIAPFAVVEIIEQHLKVQFVVKFYLPPHPTDKDYTLACVAQDTVQVFPFDTFMDLELFNIYLQTRFERSKVADELFAITSRLVVNEGIEQSDDGRSMKVTTRKGVSAASAVSSVVSSQFNLSPYRAFVEAKQVESAFQLRFRDNGDKTASVALFETDGGRWIVDAKRNVAEKLDEYGFPFQIYY